MNLFFSIVLRQNVVVLGMSSILLSAVREFAEL